MKSLLLAALMVFNLSHAWADESDLPIPGGDDGTIQPLPLPEEPPQDQPTQPPQQPPQQPPAQPVPPSMPPHGPGVDSDNKFTVGDRALAVMDGIFITGTIAAISRDGKIITIRQEFNGQFTSVKSKYVGVWVSCNNEGHCVGAKGMYEYNRGRNYNPVRIEAVYSNGYVLVQEEESSSKYVAKSKEVLHAVSCDLRSGICPNQTVLTGPVNGYPYFETKVLDVYEDGVFLVTTLNGGKDIRKRDDLSRAATCYRGKCVGQQLSIGNILRVYENGFFVIQDPYSGILTLRPYREIRW